MKLLFILLIPLTAASLNGAEIKPIHKLNQSELQARFESDARAVRLHRDGLRTVIRYAESHPDLFPDRKDRNSGVLRREQKEEVWNAWQSFLDYMLALDSIEQYHSGFYRLKGAAREDSFLIGYAAMVAKYRAALEFISHTDATPEFDKVLNDPVPEIGLPSGTFAKLKFKYLNGGTATEFVAHEVLKNTFPGGRQAELRDLIRADSKYVWETGKGRGELMTVKNALKIVGDGANRVWLPVQTGVSEWMGDTKVYRPGKSLITAEQIAQLQPKLEPGDILLERREWYLSNVGLPGFWSHAALYIGTPAERLEFFNDAETREWLAKQDRDVASIEELLRLRYPAAYARSVAFQEQAHVPRIIEAIGEGVLFTTLEHSAACDSLAVLRPRLPKTERARAIVRAFHYSGRPYDFEFDFSTDAALVCTELVYKSYEPASDMTGLKFPIIEMLGRKVTPANELAKQFDAQFGSIEQQYDLVLFLDGKERQKRAEEGSLADFRASWKRPKWHVLVQNQKR